jgi:LytS/YehU family sensor histidine kinase
MYNKKRTLDKLTQGKLIAKAKLEALRAQLKPHFIFNSLNAIKDFIYNNKNDAAADLLQGFAGLIRKGLNLADRDFITIYEEAAFLKQYLELEQAKCDYCFDFRFDVSEKIANIVIPSLITQPFVENAVIHGIRSVKNKKAVLLITYSLIDNDVVCCIADNGIGIKQSLLHKKIEYSKGTAISKDRISYFKTGLGIDILLDVQDRAETQTNTHGTIVTITIKNATQYIKP